MKGSYVPTRSLTKHRLSQAEPGRSIVTNSEAELYESVNKGDNMLRPHYLLSSKLKMELDEEKKSVNDLSRLISKVDTMSEELRKQRKTIAELEDERVRLLDYKSQVTQIKGERDFFKKENEALREELRSTKNEMAETDRKRRIEIEKFKRSFDEMDELLGKEKEAHKTEEEKLVNIIAELEDKLRVAQEVASEKARNEKFYLEELSTLKESKGRLQENWEISKRRESDNEALYKKAKETLSELQIQNKDLTSMIEKVSLENMQLKSALEAEREKSERLLKGNKELDFTLEKVEQESKELHKKYEELADSFYTTKTELDKCQKVINYQSEDIDALNQEYKKHSDLAKTFQAENNNLKERIKEIEKDKKEVEAELVKEKQNGKELEELVLALNNNRTYLEDQLVKYKAEGERLKDEIHDFASLKKDLAMAKAKELALLNRAVNNAYQENLL